MSIWQFLAAVDGYVKANSTDKSKLDTKQVDEIWAWLQEKD